MSDLTDEQQRFAEIVGGELAKKWSEEQQQTKRATRTAAEANAAGLTPLLDAITALEGFSELYDDEAARLLAERIDDYLSHNPVPTLQKRVEALRFYGTGCEAVELFRAVCGLCYRMSGLGLAKQAETLYLWAREMAEDSRSFQEDERPDEMEDFEQGVFDYDL